MIKIRCLTPKCQWVGYMQAIGGRLVNRTPEGEWMLTPCPRCHKLYAAYA